MIRAHDAQPGCLPADRLVPTNNNLLCLYKLAMACGMVKRHLELFRSEENQPFYACGEKNTVRAHINTPATEKLALAET